MPILFASEHSINFKRVLPAKTAAIAVRIQNEGEETLSLTASIPATMFKLTPTKLSLKPGAAGIVEIKFTSPNNGGFTQTDFVLQSNDPLRRSIRLPVSANGLGNAVGDTHADFTLTDLNGTQHTLSKLKGKVVLLVYFATF